MARHGRRFFALAIATALFGLVGEQAVAGETNRSSGKSSADKGGAVAEAAKKRKKRKKRRPAPAPGPTVPSYGFLSGRASVASGSGVANTPIYHQLLSATGWITVGQVASTSTGNYSFVAITGVYHRVSASFWHNYLQTFNTPYGPVTYSCRQLYAGESPPVAPVRGGTSTSNVVLGPRGTGAC